MSTKHLKIIYLVFLLSFLILPACNEQTATSYVSGGCTPMNVSSSATGDTTSDSVNLDGSGAIELPITIAKSIDGVDPTTLTFSATGGSSNISTPFLVDTIETKYASTDSIGTITGDLLNDATGTVALYLDGEFTTTVDTDSNGNFSFSITSAAANTPIALVQVGSGFVGNSVDDETSAPVFMTVYYDDFREEYTAIVHISNTNSEVTTESVALDISDAQLATSHFDNVAFMGTNSSSTPVVSTIGYTGGTNENLTLSSSLTNTLTSLVYDSDENLYGVDNNSSTATIYKITSSGTVSTLGNANSSNVSGRTLKMHPSGKNYLATVISSTLPANNKSTLNIGIIDLNTGELFEVPISPTETLVTTSLSFSWSDPTRLFVIRKFENDTYKALDLDITGVVTGQNVTYADVVSSSFTKNSYIGNPTNNYTQRINIYYECLNGSIIDICAYNKLTQTELGPLTDESYNVSNLKMAWDNSYIIFTLTGNDSNGDDFSEVALFDTQDETVSYLGTGYQPMTIPADVNLVTFLHQDPTDAFQVGIANVSSFSFTQDTLSIDSNIQLALNNAVGIGVTGGLAPYTFTYTSTSNIGDFDAAMGFFDASPTTTGSGTVTVTDANGDSVSTTLTVNSGIDLNASSSYLARGTSLTFNTSGGGSTYTYSLVSGGGSINQDTGFYTSANAQGETQIRVTDEYGNTDNFYLTIAGVNGEEDESFDTDGIVTTNLPNNITLHDVIVDNQNNTFAVGQYNNGTDEDIIIFKYAPNGSLDTNFDNDGYVQIDVANGNDIAYSVDLDSSNNLYVAGSSFDGANDKLIVVKLNSQTGVQDTSFGPTNNGIQTHLVSGPGVNNYARKVIAQSDQTIFVCGYSNTENMIVAKLSQDGSLDNTFAGTGALNIDFNVEHDRAYDCELTSDNKVILGGFATIAGQQYLSLAKVSSTGVLDTSFDGDGKLTSAVPGQTNSQILDIKISPEADAIYAVGFYINGDQDSVMAKYNINDGSLINAFGTNGIKTVDAAPAANDRFTTLSFTNVDSTPFVFGYTASSGTMTKIQSGDGALDNSFNGGIVKTYDQSAGADTFNASYYSLGRITIVGQATGDALLLKTWE